MYATDRQTVRRQTRIIAFMSPPYEGGGIIIYDTDDDIQKRKLTTELFIYQKVVVVFATHAVARHYCAARVY